ncbi:hypothetical protein [Actinospongicola halichondriae]|uniref:hypothetical protein n=1 Tax=Actinospongicola halichondriae TaxID=3236844 RepID=UPI003D3C7E0B
MSLRHLLVTTATAVTIALATIVGITATAETTGALPDPVAALPTTATETAAASATDELPTRATIGVWPSTVVIPTPAPAPVVVTPPTTTPAPVEPPPTTTAPPAPEPAPAPTPSIDPGPAAGLERARAAIEAYVPARHRDRVDYVLEWIPGNTSWAWPNRLVQIGAGQADDSWDHIAFVAVHEIGHLVAYEYGTNAYLGAPPTGFPGAGNAAEVWADCYAFALTGFEWDMHCNADQKAWTRNWISQN